MTVVHHILSCSRASVQQIFRRPCVTDMCGFLNQNIRELTSIQTLDSCSIMEIPVVSTQMTTVSSFSIVN